MSNNRYQSTDIRQTLSDENWHLTLYIFVCIYTCKCMHVYAHRHMLTAYI